jgi:hypothetical protein
MSCELLVPDSSSFEVHTIPKFKMYKFPGTDPVLADMIQAGLKQYNLRFINTLILLGIEKNCLSILRK